MNVFRLAKKSDRAMAALQTYSKLTPAERVKLHAALQSLNNNSSFLSSNRCNKKPQQLAQNVPRVLSTPMPQFGVLPAFSPQVRLTKTIMISSNSIIELDSKYPVYTVSIFEKNSISAASA